MFGEITALPLNNDFMRVMSTNLVSPRNMVHVW
jgi:hypothetical protein